MGQETRIGWCHHTFNPWWGCVEVSPECAHCYARTFDKRVGGDHWGVDAPRRFFGDAHWAEPFKWDRAAKAAGERRRVFCASMADVFEDRRDLDDPREQMWALIRATPNLDWLLLTKRPQNFSTMLPWDWGTGYRNVWLGVTAGLQWTAAERIPILRETPAVMRFVSCEPMLESVSMTDFLPGVPLAPGKAWADCLCLEIAPSDCPCVVCEVRGIDWVIIGAESGAKNRPMEEGWARALKDEVVASGAKVFLKQFADNRGRAIHLPVLDGRQWAEFPEAGQ